MGNISKLFFVVVENFCRLLAWCSVLQASAAETD